MDRESRDLARHLQRTPRKKEVLAAEHVVDEERENIESTNLESNCTDSVYREISLMNGLFNRMNVNDLKAKCKEHRLNTAGQREALKRRLKEHYKMTKLVEAGLLEPKANRNADYLVVIDFEATCEEKNPPGFPHEIIEFPAVLISTGPPGPRVADIFHTFVRPTVRPCLSDFCRALTGIEQPTVDAADEFGRVHAQFSAWMRSHGLGLTKTFVVVTDGPFDMGRFLYLQSKHSGIEFPPYGMYWANLRKVFANFYKEGFYNNNNGGCPNGQKLPGLKVMLAQLGMQFEGQPHCGLDDAKNIARIVMRLVEDGAVIKVNEKINADWLTGQPGDGSSRSKLYNVLPVMKKDREAWIKQQRQNLQQPGGC